MANNYLLGVILALLAGLTNALGTILQKTAVNRIVSRNRDNGFVSSYVRDPVWVAGIVLTFGLGTLFNLSAQNRIGPALVPALMASGLVFLALGSAKLLDEKLETLEWLGIASLVVGISLLGFSGLQILRREVDLLNPGTQFRIAAFSLGIALAWVCSWWTARKASLSSSGTLLAVSSGLPFCLSNLWILPLLMTIGLVFSGQARVVEFTFFVLSCIILVGTNILGVHQTQESFRFAPANKVLPFQQVTVQVAPIFIYLYVFQRSISAAAIILVPLGVLLILAGGFLLGNRHAESGSPESSQA